MGLPGLVVPISGPYKGFWNGLALGVQHDDGYELEVGFPGQEIRESDAYGMTLVEAIYRGMNWKCRLHGLEFASPGLIAVGIKMFGTYTLATDGLLTPTLLNIGDRWTNYAQVLLLSAYLGNPPTQPKTLTAANAGFSMNTTSAFQMTSKMRELPVELDLIPYATVAPGTSLGVTVPFTMSMT